MRIAVTRTGRLILGVSALCIGGLATPASAFDLEDYKGTYRATRDAYFRALGEVRRVKPYYDAIQPIAVSLGCTTEAPMLGEALNIVVSPSGGRSSTAPTTRVECRAAFKACTQKYTRCSREANGTRERRACSRGKRECAAGNRVCMAFVNFAKKTGRDYAEQDSASGGSSGAAAAAMTPRQAAEAFIATAQPSAALAEQLLLDIAAYEADGVNRELSEIAPLPDPADVQAWLDEIFPSGVPSPDQCVAWTDDFNLEEGCGAYRGQREALVRALRELTLASPPFQAAAEAVGAAADGFFTKERCGDLFMPAGPYTP